MEKLLKYTSFEALKNDACLNTNEQVSAIRRHKDMEAFIALLRQNLVKRAAIQKGDTINPGNYGQSSS